MYQHHFLALFMWNILYLNASGQHRLSALDKNVGYIYPVVNIVDECSVLVSVLITVCFHSGPSE